MKILFTLLLFFHFLDAIAQPNMVPNGSFEYSTSCPTRTAQLVKAIGWSNYQNTPDYFNSCYTTGPNGTGVPANKWGYENAASGNAYAGASFYSRRESFTSAISPLVPVRSYEVSLSISLADQSKYAVDGIGVYFFDKGPVSVGRNLILTPQVDFSSGGPVTTMSGWVRLTGYFVADSTYDNIVIGNFRSDTLLNVVTFSSGTVPYAYYYFDSIVVKAENLALKFNDTLLCAGDSLVVPYFANSDSFTNANVFSLQLSDSLGSFAAGTTTLATASGRNSGIFRTIVPATLVPSYRYRMRVVSTNQPFASRDNGKDLAIGTSRPNKPVASCNTPVCTADTLRLSATTTSTGTFTWQWKGPNKFTSAQQHPKISNPSTAASGSYYVTVFNYGCISKDTTAVLVNTSPAPIVASSNGPVCEQDTLRLYSTLSSPGVNYSWTGPGGFSSSSRNAIVPNAPATANGKYYVVATAANGCLRRDSLIILVKPKPFVSASNNSPACVHNNVSLNATTTIGGAMFSWIGPNSYAAAGQNPSISMVQTTHTGTYTVTASLDGCIDTGVTSVTVNPLPSLSMSSNSPVCLLDTVKLFATATTGVSYSWAGPVGFLATIAAPFIANADTINEGYYRLTVTDTNGCSREDSVSVMTKPLPVSHASNSSPVCAGTSFGLNATTTYTGVSFNWNGPNGFNSTSAAPTVNIPPAAASGAYVLTATMNGCTYSTVTNATVHPIPVAHPGARQPVCIGSTLQLTGNSYAGATYQWTGPSYSSTSQNPAIAATSTTQSGDYVLVMTANGCVSEPDTVNVRVNVFPKIGAYVSPNDTICLGTTPTFVAFLQDGGPAPVMQWYKNNIAVGNPNTLRYTSPATLHGDTYYCKLTAPGVCYNALVLTTDTIKMAVLPIANKPQVNITADPGLNVRPTDMVKFTANVTYGGTSPKYQWYKNGVKQTGAITASYTATGLSYMDIIHVDIISEDPCAQDKNASDTVWMQFPAGVKDINKNSIKLYPNPNNGSFTVTGISTREAKIEIINAIGQVLYKQTAEVQNGMVQLNPGLIPGSYLLKIDLGGRQEVLRFSVLQ